MNLDTPLEAALGYAEQGLPVLPLRGKIPRTLHGKDDASLDPEVIRSWWTRWPRSNVGVRPPAGIIVLDVDPRNGGDAELDRLRVLHGGLPPTLTARTGRGDGGLHIWLAYGGPAKSKIHAGIDVKRETGYLVAPPSIHPDSGKPYEWVRVATTAPAPGWLRRLLAPPPIRRPARTDAPVSLEPLLRVIHEDPGGELNNRLFWACCRAHESGLDTTPLIEAAVAKGHPRRSAERTAQSAANAPRKGVA